MDKDMPLDLDRNYTATIEIQIPLTAEREREAWQKADVIGGQILDFVDGHEYKVTKMKEIK